MSETRGDEREALREAVLAVMNRRRGTSCFVAKGIADELVALGYRKHPEPEITDEMVVVAAVAMFEDRYGPGEWADRVEVEEEVYRKRARVVLEAALRVPVSAEGSGEGEQ